MQLDIAVYHQTVKGGEIWKSVDGKMDQKVASKFLSTMKKNMITPLLIIEEESSTMYTTAQSLAAKLIEQFRLMRAQSLLVTQVTGFAFPAPECCDFDTVSCFTLDADDAAADGDEDHDDDPVGGHGGGSNMTGLNQSILQSNFNIATSASCKRDCKGNAIIRTAPTKVAVSWDTISFQLKISYHVYRLSEIECDTFSTAVADAVRNAKKNNQTHDNHLIGYNFTLQLYESEIREVEKNDTK